MITIDEEISVPLPINQVWGILSEPEIVAKCVPGAVLHSIGETGEFQGDITVQFGPTAAVFSGIVQLDYETESHTIIAEAQGVDGRGATQASANGTVRLIESDDGSLIRINGVFNFTGPLSQFAKTGGVFVARALIAQFAKNMNDYVVSDTKPLDGGVSDPGADTGQVDNRRLRLGPLIYQSIGQALKSIVRKVRRPSSTLSNLKKPKQD